MEQQLAASGSVDVLAHVDVVKVHGDVLESPPLDLYERVVEAAAASGTAVEVSSAGIYKPIGEMYPAPPFLEMFQRSGVPITLASDAHEPAVCGLDSDVLIEVARQVGYNEHLTFDQRKSSTTRFPALDE